MKKSLVAFFDILGFKNLVEENSHEELMELYNVSICEAIDLAENITNGILPIVTPKREVNSLKIKIFTISDSIILVQDEVSELGLLYLIHYSQCILGLLIADGIPARGSISFGPVSILENRGTTIFGLGLTKAYNLEAKKEWSGCTIDKECFDVALNFNPSFIENLINNGMIVKYEVPIKEGFLNDQFVVNWTIYKLKNGVDDLKSAFSKNKKQINDSVSIKMENTIQFYNSIKQ